MRGLKRFASALLAFAIGFAPSLALAAPCCGAHAAIPSLLTGIETFRLNAAFLHSVAVGDAPNQGLSVFRKAEDQTTADTLALSGSVLLSERFQMGAAAPISTQGYGVGDVDLIAAFEAVENEDEAPLHPKVYVFTQMTIPAGTSIYESKNTLAKDVTGAGFYKFGLGVAAISTYRKWDGFSVARVSQAFEREFDGHQRVTVRPGIQGDLALGGGYSITGEWRVGASVQSVFGEGRRIERTGAVSKTGSTLVWPVQAQVSWFRDANTTLSLSYLDETLLGPVRNTTLSRSVALQYSFRWGT